MRRLKRISIILIAIGFIYLLIVAVALCLVERGRNRAIMLIQY